MGDGTKPGKTNRLLREPLFRRLKKRPALLVVGGLGIGAVAVGILLVLLHFVIQPFSRPETRGYVTFEGEHFKLWYDDESERIDGRHELEAVLEREYADLLELMGVSDTVIERRMDVFIHDSVPRMQHSILRRKSITAGAVFHYPFDVLADDSPRRALVEVLLYYGWGGCFSPALYAGTVEYLASPELSYLSIVKAAPDEMTHSLAELVVLEERGSFPSTMYQQLTGPTAQTAITDFASMKVFFSLPTSLAEANIERFHVLEMASLVEFLVEQRGGMETLARAWGPGFLSALLQRVDESESVPELNGIWQEAVEALGDIENVPELRRVELLLEGGFSERAFAHTQTWASGGGARSLEECAVAARCALATGAFDASASWIERLDASVRPEYESLLRLYEGWARRETPEIVVVAPAEIVDVAFERIDAGYLALCERTGTTLLEKSGVRPIVFAYSDPADRDVGAQLASANPVTLCGAHVAVDDDIEYSIAELVLPRLWTWWPISPLVRIGVLTALVTERSELIERGASLFCSEAWLRISGLSVGAAPDAILRTETGLLASQVESIQGLEGLQALWISGRERGRISLETALHSVTGHGVRELEDRILTEVISCD